MTGKRITEQQTLETAGSGWYVLLDSATGGTRKYDMGDMLDAAGVVASIQSDYEDAEEARDAALAAKLADLQEDYETAESSRDTAYAAAEAARDAASAWSVVDGKLCVTHFTGTESDMMEVS